MTGLAGISCRPSVGAGLGKFTATSKGLIGLHCEWQSVWSNSILPAVAAPTPEWEAFQDHRRETHFDCG